MLTVIPFNGWLAQPCLPGRVDLDNEAGRVNVAICLASVVTAVFDGNVAEDKAYFRVALVFGGWYLSRQTGNISQWRG